MCLKYTGRDVLNGPRNNGDFQNANGIIIDSEKIIDYKLNQG